MIKFQTESGSLYELDEENCRVRRLLGVKDPTPRQGQDGEWTQFTEASAVIVGEPVAFLWSMGSVDSNGGFVIAKTTLTSSVTKILSEEDLN